MWSIDQYLAQFDAENKNQMQIELETVRQSDIGNKYARRQVHYIVTGKQGRIPLNCSHTVKTNRGRLITVLPKQAHEALGWLVLELVCTQCGKTVCTAIRKLKKPKRRF